MNNIVEKKSMKKILMMSAAAVAVFSVSCSKVEDMSKEQEISFAVASYVPQTKAESIRTVDGIESFSCKAFLHANGAAVGTDYFGASGVTIQYNSSTATWAPANHPYYWPKHPDSYINFVSWYDNGTGPTGTVTETAMAWTNRTIGPNDNIMFADEAWRFKSNDNAVYKKDGVTAGVPTLFHHALAKVNIQFNTSPLVDPNDSNVTFEVQLQTVQLQGVYTQGSMSLANSDNGSLGQKAWTAANATYLWDTTGSTTNYDLVTSDTALTDSFTTVFPTAATQTSFAGITAQTVLPQAVTTGMKLVITYAVTIKYKAGTANEETILAEHDIPATVQLNTLTNSSSVAITQWLPNKIYTYSITINPLTDQILIDPAIEADWATENVSATIE